VPDAIADKVWLKATDSDNTRVSDVLDEPISIEGALDLVRPRGGVAFKVDSSQSIRWKTQGSIPKVDIQYSDDGFMRRIFSAAEDYDNVGAFEWKVPDFISRRVDLRVVDSNNDQIFTMTEKPFKIEGYLEFASLIQDETWIVGESKLIDWISTGSIQDVRLEYSQDDFQDDVHVIYDSVPNQQGVKWTIPEHLGGAVRLRVQDMNDPAVAAVTAGHAEVLGDLDFIAPSVGERVAVGQPVKIQSSLSNRQ